MSYDVFLSYTRHDASWARKLEENLRSRGLRVFRDEQRITAGDEWQDTLREAIVESQALVVLWSSEAAQSKWVLKEQEAFRQMMHVDSRDGRVSTRRLLQLCLGATHPEYAEYQSVADLSDPNIYTNGVATVDPNLWSRTVEKVAAGLSVEPNLPMIHQVILASTSQRMQALADDHRPVEDAAPYVDLISGLNFVSKQELTECYGNERSEWRPFGGRKSILTLLNELREELLKRGTAAFLWKPVGEEAWSGVEKKRQLRDLLSEAPCVIVLDAVSLYDTTIRERYDWLLACLTNPKAAIAVLPPYSIREHHTLRTVLESAAARMFEPFYRPDRASVPIAASCSLMAEDPYEVGRVVASMMKIAFGKEKNAKLRFGASRQ
jgi:TIR domain